MNVAAWELQITKPNLDISFPIDFNYSSYLQDDNEEVTERDRWYVACVISNFYLTHTLMTINENAQLDTEAAMNQYFTLVEKLCHSAFTLRSRDFPIT